VRTKEPGVTLRRMRALFLVLLGVTVLVELTMVVGLAALLIWLQAPATIVVGTTMIMATVGACLILGMRLLRNPRPTAAA
jgi:hypothetical protein